QMAPSGAYNSSGHLVTSGFDVGRVAIGQGGAEGQDLTSPLQMAEVAAAVADGGKLMRPTFVQQVTDPDGWVTDKLSPKLQSMVDAWWGSAAARRGRPRDPSRRTRSAAAAAAP